MEVFIGLQLTPLRWPTWERKTRKMYQNVSLSLPDNCFLLFSLCFYFKIKNERCNLNIFVFGLVIR